MATLAPMTDHISELQLAERSLLCPNADRYARYALVELAIMELQATSAISANVRSSGQRPTFQGTTHKGTIGSR